MTAKSCTFKTNMLYLHCNYKFDMDISKEIEQLCAMTNTSSCKQDNISLEKSYEAISRYDKDNYEVHSYSSVNNIKI